MLAWLAKFKAARRVEEPTIVLAAERVAARRGDVETALKGYHALLRDHAATGTEPNHGPPPPTALLLEQADAGAAAADALWIEAATTLAEDLANFTADFGAARQTLRRKLELQAAWRRTHGAGEDLHIGEDLTRTLGHIGLIQYAVKLKRLGLAPWRRIVVASRREKVSNPALLAAYAGEVLIESDPRRIAELAPRVCAEGLRYLDLLEWPGQAPIFAREASNVIEALWWQRQGGQALLRLDDERDAAGRAMARAIGLPDGATFVCLHVREANYYGDNSNPQRHFHITDYLPAIRAVTDRGDWLVRLGGSSMSRLPPMERVIDYAHSDRRAPELDVWLAARCRFLIGTHSGPMFMPHLFGRPALITNYDFLYGAPPLGPTSRFLPRPMMRGRRSLSFAAMMTDKHMKATGLHKVMRAYGLSSISNTPLEILEAVLEMYEPAPPDERQRRFTALAPETHRAGNALIGARFVARHAALL